MGTDEIGGESRVRERFVPEAAHGLIRGAVPSDLAQIEELVARTIDHPWRRAQIETALSGPLARVLVRTDARRGADSVLAGFVLARRIADGVEIDLVGVDPGHRRRGVARQLLTSLIEAERAAGARAVRLELADSNTAARALYESLGFVVVGRRSRYYPDGADALLLTLAWE